MRPSLALTGGVANPTDGVKALLAGAHAVQMVSAVLRHGPAYLTVMRDRLARWAVIADAVFASPQDRAEIAAVAREAGVPFSGVWVDAPPQVLMRRISDRAVDASDAAADVLERQLGSGTGPLDWRRVDGSVDAETVLQRARTVLS